MTRLRPRAHVNVGCRQGGPVELEPLRASSPSRPRACRRGLTSADTSGHTGRADPGSGQVARATRWHCHPEGPAQRQDRSSSLRCGRSVLTTALTQCCLPGGRKPAKPLVHNLLTQPRPFRDDSAHRRTHGTPPWRLNHPEIVDLEQRSENWARALAQPASNNP